MKNRKLILIILLIFLLALSSNYSKTYAKTFPLSEDIFQVQLKECLEIGSGIIHIVAKDGSGDFTSIQEAVDKAYDGDTIVINSGTYEEYVRIKDKELFLIGTDSKKCIIKQNADTYQNAVLDIGKGRLYNLVIYAYADPENRQRESLIDITKVAESQGNEELKKSIHDKALGYAIHADQEDMINSELIIKNCKIVSDANQCLGLGVREGNKVIIENCEIVSSGQGGCIYYHNTRYPLQAKKSYLSISDSEMVNMMSPYFMSLHSLTNNHPVELTFRNNVIKTIAFDTRDGYNEINVYTGEDIESMLAHNEQGLVKEYNLKESRKYLLGLYKNEDTLNFEDGLATGINYLEIDFENNIKDYRKKVVVIEIYNFDGKVGNGWMGLENFSLSKDSYGNTMPEMNYGFINGR